MQELLDRAELTDLLARQGRWLDERRWDATGSIFTEDATVSTGGGRAHGIEAITEHARLIHERVDRTQHVTSNVLVDLDGDAATVRANVVAIFVSDTTPSFAVGERYHFTATRTDAGWRFTSVEVMPVWRSGEPPAA
ncbi:nuclear transport factor 2 family protein [Actinoallomurus acaciae]|uniref:Nuclear transport factor 2 family protein n=1 Tax=Actinoallomurus acaciae TaxID=502577 RepID=A0ABV5Y832_9ACTN